MLSSSFLRCWGVRTIVEGLSDHGLSPDSILLPPGFEKPELRERFTPMLSVLGAESQRIRCSYPFAKLSGLNMSVPYSGSACAVTISFSGTVAGRLPPPG
jgi:hypothetical protein